MPLAVLGLAVSFLMCLWLIPVVVRTGQISYYLGSWEPPFGIEIRIDFLGCFMMVLVLIVSLLVIIYSARYIPHDIDAKKIPTYYTLFLLLSASMLGFSATGDIFNMFVFLEIMAITSYALVAVSASSRATLAALKYLLMGAPSSVLILLAISFLYAVTGTLNMRDLADKITMSSYTNVIAVTYVIFIIGFAVKAALFPLHSWLPDAHSIAPSPVSALLSGLVVKMGVFGIMRLTYSVYRTHFMLDMNEVNRLLIWVAVGAVVYGSVMAIRQKDLKRMIAYSTVSHIGYIFIGIGLMNRASLTGSVFHILDHSLAKAALFLLAGSIVYKSGYRKVEELKGSAKRMPLTCAAFALASLSVVGIPPSAGFVSKWYLVLGSLNEGAIIFAAVILLGSMMAAWYCFRIVYYMFFLPDTEGRWREIHGEAPNSMLATSWILALATLLFGVFASRILPVLKEAIEAIV
jgi:multicomponent Na+:H+ antiporter subunit D